MAVRPSVVEAFFQRVECLVGPVVAEMIGALICGEQKGADPSKSYCISQTARENSLSAPVRVHFQHRRTDLLLLNARIAARSDRNVQLAVRSEGDRPCQVPSTVLVAQTVIWEGRDGLRILSGRLVFPSREFSSCKSFSFSNVDPILAIGIPIKLDAVRIVQTTQILRHFRKLSDPLVPSVEYVDDTALVIGQVVHIGDEYASIRSFCKKARPP